MIDHDRIAPPPSLADILAGGEDLIGRVDFGSRLVPAVPADEPSAVAGPAGPAAPDVEAEIESGVESGVEAPAAKRPALAPAEPGPEEPDGAGQVDEPDRSAPAYPDRRSLPTTPAPSEAAEEEDVAHRGLSVEEVAESARARMRAAELAHLRHLEAAELEAARRLELLTAQAELDAELIRLQARREAHAIVTAARVRTGSADGPSPDERRLADVDGSVSRFAETLASALDSSLAPDHRRSR